MSRATIHGKRGRDIYQSFVFSNLLRSTLFLEAKTSSHTQASVCSTRSSNIKPLIILTMPSDTPLQGDMQYSTHPRLHVRDARDAHTVFEAVRQGFLRPVTRRLNEMERSMYVQSGAVFVWEESDDESGLKRWTGTRSHFPQTQSMGL